MSGHLSAPPPRMNTSIAPSDAIPPASCPVGEADRGGADRQPVGGCSSCRLAGTAARGLPEPRSSPSQDRPPRLPPATAAPRRCAAGSARHGAPRRRAPPPSLPPGPSRGRPPSRSHPAAAASPAAAARSVTSGRQSARHSCTCSTSSLARRLAQTKLDQATALEAKTQAIVDAVAAIGTPSARRSPMRPPPPTCKAVSTRSATTPRAESPEALRLGRVGPLARGQRNRPQPRRVGRGTAAGATRRSRILDRAQSSVEPGQPRRATTRSKRSTTPTPCRGRRVRKPEARRSPTCRRRCWATRRSPSTRSSAGTTVEGRSPAGPAASICRPWSGSTSPKASAEGVRGDVAFAQAMVETGAFTSPLTRHNNFAGIGACDSCPTGFDFDSPQLGVRAQMQLLHAYADKSLTILSLANPAVGC